MPTQFSFGISHTYTDRENGIAVPVTLLFGEERIEIPAIVDTGSTFCLFQRRFGEALGLDVEAGISDGGGPLPGIRARVDAFNLGNRSGRDRLFLCR